MWILQNREVKYHVDPTKQGGYIYDVTITKKGG